MKVTKKRLLSHVLDVSGPRTYEWMIFNRRDARRSPISSNGCLVCLPCRHISQIHRSGHFVIFPLHIHRSSLACITRFHVTQLDVHLIQLTGSSSGCNHSFVFQNRQSSVRDFHRHCIIRTLLANGCNSSKKSSALYDPSRRHFLDIVCTKLIALKFSSVLVRSGWSRVFTETFGAIHAFMPKPSTTEAFYSCLLTGKR